MKERPIIFSGPMVRAILDGRKMQTRRVVKKKKWHSSYSDSSCVWNTFEYEMTTPYGRPGDRLWVRETHAIVPATAYRHSVEDNGQKVPHRISPDGHSWAVYRADWSRSAPMWKPSIHMPRWASRITLEVTSVRVERLQDISEEDAVSEGLIKLPATGRYVLAQGEQYLGLAASDPRDVFSRLWNSINAKRGHGWDTDPLVWVVEFRRVEP